MRLSEFIEKLQSLQGLSKGDPIVWTKRLPEHRQRDYMLATPTLTKADDPGTGEKLADAILID